MTIEPGYRLSFVLYDYVACSALFIGQWELGKGPEPKIQPNHSGTMELDGTKYSWALRNGLKDEMENLLNMSEDPCIVRRIRIPGEKSTPEKPTSVFESILKFDDKNKNSGDSGILRVVLRGHLCEKDYCPWKPAPGDIRFLPHQENWGRFWGYKSAH